ncbi:MAG: Tudor-knot domain-containing protein [Methylovulum sp.]|nr:Tudor-knot domain-containing protein [Methylovulum sp.]
MLIKKYLLIWLACIAGFVSTPIVAQQPSYSIYNDTSTPLSFETLDPGRGTWRNQAVNPHQLKSFTINSGMPSGKIRIGTPTRGYNEYTVGTGGVYRLTWNEQKQMWDVTTDQQSYNQAPGFQGQQNPIPDNRHQSGTKLPYRLGDAVMVLWKSNWYPATVIQLAEHKVKIHYDNYDNSWDEWVGNSRIRYR